jgi:hypothetical protein
LWSYLTALQGWFLTQNNNPGGIASVAEEKELMKDLEWIVTETAEVIKDKNQQEADLLKVELQKVQKQLGVYIYIIFYLFFQEQLDEVSFLVFEGSK